VRLTVRAYPSAKRAGVGGRYGSDEPPVLIVRVTAPAVDGKANEAVLRAVAAAVGVPRRSAWIVSGAESRTKVVELDGADPQALAALLAQNVE
jgi:uncharacterized protein YggU (UPF0235/DUF167 family)